MDGGCFCSKDVRITMMFNPANGGCPEIMWKRVAPNDQTSLFGVTP